jgi:N-acetylneuraminic acid mutarotase
MNNCFSKATMVLMLFVSLFISCKAQQRTDGWQVLATENKCVKRHESGFVECDGKFYALGGRGKRPIEEFDPAKKTWTVLADAPVDFHHFQAVSFNHEVYVIGAMTGSYPHEKPLPHFLIFNPKTKQWREGAGIPAERLRGSCGVFVRGEKIYMVAGIIDGHWDGHVKWFDEFDTKTGKWAILPDAPRARDHFQAAIAGDSLYLAGGRMSHAAIGKVLDLTIGEVDVYDFTTKRWSTYQHPLPTPRAGTASLAKDSLLVVLLGESTVQERAHAEVEVLNTRTGIWSRMPSMKQGRHGTGAVYHGGKIYVAAGSANRGGGPELDDVESVKW